MCKLAADSKYSSIQHFSHDDHKLVWKTDPIQFECNGCQEIGWGASFRCETCKFHLHDVCAKHDAFIPLPFKKGPELEFIWCTFGHNSCAACGRAVKGCGYHQRKGKEYSLHPLCAKLPGEITDVNVNDDQRFYLHHKLKSKCCLCGGWKPQGGVGELTGWSYRSTCKNYDIHVSCAKEIGVKMCEVIERTGENSFRKEISLAPNLKMTSERSGENSFRKEISLAPSLKLISESSGENSFSKEITLAPNLKMISERSGTRSSGRKIRLFCKVGKVVLRFAFNILIQILVGVPIDGIISGIVSII